MNPMESAKRGTGRARQPRNYLAAHQTRAEAYECANCEAARIILADPRYAGGLMVEWARALLEGRDAERRPWRLSA